MRNVIIFLAFETCTNNIYLFEAKKNQTERNDILIFALSFFSTTFRLETSYFDVNFTSLVNAFLIMFKHIFRFVVKRKQHQLHDFDSDNTHK